MIERRTSNILCFMTSTVYVMGLYLVPARIRELPRDNTEHIRYRLAITTVSNMLTLALVGYCFTFLVTGTALENQSFYAAMGFRFDNVIMAVTSTALLMIVFYGGPVVAFLCYLWVAAARNAQLNQSISTSANSNKDSPPLRREVPQQHCILPVSSSALWVDILVDQWKDMLKYPEISIRMLVFAPISEELIFRSVIILLALSAVPVDQPADSFRVALTCPFWFAVAHIHHAFTLWKEEYVPSKDVNQKSAFLRSIFIRTAVQLTYTTIFGVIAALLYLRTGNIMAPITSHVICNYAQLPNVSFMRISGTDNASRRIPQGDYSCLYTYRHIMLVLHAGGLIAFSCLLFPLTQVASQQSVLWGRGALQR